MVLEYSDNLPAPLDHAALLLALQQVLERSGEFKRPDIKGRVIALDRFRVGTGDPADVFVHLTLSIMTGRSVEFRKRLGAELVEVLKRGLGATWEERRCDVTVDVREMERETYAKEVSQGG